MAGRCEEGRTIDVFRIIDELEQLVENGKGRLFGKVVIDEEAFYVQTGRLRKSLPDVIKQASDIVKKREDLLGHADTDASRLLSDAQEESQRLRTDARAQAERLVATAREQAERLVSGAHDQQEQILEEARRVAERIEADAQSLAEQLVAENTIVQRAQQAADETHRQAIEDSDDLRQQAAQWSMARLQQLEAVLLKMATSVQEGKQQIASETSHRPAPPAANGHANGRAVAPAAVARANGNGDLSLVDEGVAAAQE